MGTNADPGSWRNWVNQQTPSYMAPFSALARQLEEEYQDDSVVQAIREVAPELVQKAKSPNFYWFKDAIKSQHSVDSITYTSADIAGARRVVTVSKTNPAPVVPDGQGGC